MERKYLLRKNYKSRRSEPGKETVGHLAFKTKNAVWAETPSPTLALISIQSLFHEGEEGALKIEAFLSVIRSSVQSPATALIADTAHLEVRRLAEGDEASFNCLQEAKALVSRFEQFFAGYELIHWHTLEKMEEFTLLRSEISALSKSDMTFRRLLEEDARSTWTHKRQELYPNQEIFIEKAIEDLLNQCACLQLLAKRGYRYLFYPGASYRAYHYLEAMMPSRIEWIDVFLTLEKKTVRSMNLS